MAITLNHTIVPAHDKEASGRFFSDIFGLKYEASDGHFAPVRVNDTLTLDFDTDDDFDTHHYAFHVGDSEFDAIFKRVQEQASHLAATHGMLRIGNSTPGTAAGASTFATRTDTSSSCCSRAQTSEIKPLLSWTSKAPHARSKGK